MFSGIIEAQEPVVRVKTHSDTVTICVRRPSYFNDLRNGDSIATNGVCLTVEDFSDEEMQFTLGTETLRVTGWTTQSLLNQHVNLERSLKFGDRVHGHFVSGHVDTVAKVCEIQKGESWDIAFAIQNVDRRMIWTKGSVAIQGTSLTINEVWGEKLKVCLIPETLQRTNLKNLNLGDTVNIEYDSWAKAFVNFQEQREANL